MKARMLLGGFIVALLMAGCVTPEQRHAREYEARLKRSFGDYSTRYDRYSAVARPGRDEHGSNSSDRDS